MEEIQDLSKKINFNNLTYHYKGKKIPKNCIGFKGPLSFFRSIKEGYITLEKAEEEQKELKSNIIEIIVGNNKSEDQKSIIQIIKVLYKSREKVIKFFDDYFRIVSETKHKTKYGEGLKILSPKQMLQRLSIALAQVKAGNTSENLLNEIRHFCEF